MKRHIILLLAVVLSCIAGASKDVVIKAPSYFKSPVRDGYQLFPDSLVYPSDAVEIVIPDVGMFGRLNDYGSFPNLRKITFGNVDYLPAGVLRELPNLEEVVFNGLVGHFDCTFIYDCPKLKKVTFRGPVVSTGGPVGFYKLPMLEEVRFDNVVVALGIDHEPSYLCPKLQGFSGEGIFLYVDNDSIHKPVTIEQLKFSRKWIPELERVARWQSEVLRAKNSGWMRAAQYQNAKVLQPILAQLGSPEADKLKQSMEYAWENSDDVKSKLDILKKSPAYAPDTIKNISFSYALPNDSLLTLTRQRFNLDSIAGSGDDISRIKNLLYWVHDNITHDGSNGFPAGPRNMRNIYESSKRDSCGYNCRALAIGLAEALLAEGIPARYITCLPKAWDTDGDCHVICVAWSESLGKWIWVDPTHAAFVTDEKGLLLHPGEVRYRLQHDLPLVLNEDANWNHKSQTSKEEYLDEYMAKNLYILQANTLNQAEPEGKSSHVQGKHVALVPKGITYRLSDVNTTDEEWFWQPPVYSK